MSLCAILACVVSKGSTFSWFALHSFPASTPFHPVSTVSPLKPEEFARNLSNHPNQPQVAFVLDGLRNGFRLGFHHSRKLKSATTNKPSATVAARRGIPDHLIQALGRWSGDAYKSYIRTPSETLASLLSRLTYGPVGP